MISYQWKSQERMSKLRDKLKKEGYNVWMDIDKVGRYKDKGKLLCRVSQKNKTKQNKNKNKDKKNCNNNEGKNKIDAIYFDLFQK